MAPALFVHVDAETLRHLGRGAVLRDIADRAGLSRRATRPERRPRGARDGPRRPCGYWRSVGKISWAPHEPVVSKKFLQALWDLAAIGATVVQLGCDLLGHIP